jgi:CBS domain-containing protein
MSMRVEAILKLKGADVFTVSPDASVAEAAGLLRSKNIGALVVTGPGAAVLGILSERDIVRSYAERGLHFDGLRVRDLMTPDPVTCSLTDSGDELMDQMTQYRIRHIPVVEDGALRGMISLADVVKHRLDSCLVETDQLRQYIATA